MTTDKKVPSLLISLLPILFLIVFLAINVILYGEDSSYGPNQIALFLAAAFTGILGLRLGYKWGDLQAGMVKSISSAMGAILILFMIGALSGTWLISGVVPAMIYYGLDVLNPTIFLVAACIVSAIVSIATGSSWTTAATVGIALIGIGKAMGISEGVIAGAVISGAYFGDKMSPLSDTTNLAPAMAGTDLITHIRYMALTTGPSIVITLIIFLIWGFTLDTDVDVAQASIVQEAIASKFNIHLGLFLVPAAVVFLIIKKVPALPALLIGSLLGGVFALIFQPQLINEISGISDSKWGSSYAAVLKAMFTKTNIVTGNVTVDDLLKAKGMEGMLNTIWLIMTAMVFGGVMECTGMLKKIAQTIIARVKSTGSLVASTAATCITFNVTASDQYIAIVVPGRMFASTYRERGLAPENLSRTLEDSGTVTSVLIPWNTCGAYQSGVLGVSTLSYLPYCFFNIISPLMTIAFAYLNIKIRKLDKPSATEVNDLQNPKEVASV
jgi:NhaC family Na+:H+ antiporter